MRTLARLFNRLPAGLACVALLAGCAGMGGPPPPTLEQIVEMSRAGTPADEIIRELQKTRAVYALSGSQIARLHDQGVADPVLDYLQEVYTESVRRDTRLHYENTFFWPDCFYCYNRPVIVVPR